jgi:hypothetical protein
MFRVYYAVHGYYGVTHIYYEDFETEKEAIYCANMKKSIGYVEIEITTKNFI